MAVALRLQQVAPRRGVGWVREAFAAFARRPLAFSVLFAAFYFAATLVSIVLPVAGNVLALAALPLLSLGFMIGTQSVLRGGTVQLQHLVEPLRAAPARRNELLKLCALFAAIMIGGIALYSLFAGDTLAGFDTVADAAAPPADGASAPAPAAMTPEQAADALQGLVPLAVVLTLLQLPFWHAPALVHWGGQSAAQSLFSSTLACWRNKGAFAVYALVWIGLLVAFGVAASLVFALLGAPQLAVVAAVPGVLLFFTVFYVSLYFTFADSFAVTTASAP